MKTWGYKLTNSTNGGKHLIRYHFSDNTYKLTNSTNGGDGVSSETNKDKKLSLEHRKKISDGIRQSHKNNPSYNLTDKHPKRKIILDKEELYQKYIIENLSQPKCSKYFGVSGKVIFQNLKDYGIKKDKSIWRKQCKNNIVRKRVLQYDLEGNFLKEWISATEVAESFGVKTKYITRCLSGHRKSAKGFKWKYKKDNKS